MKLSVLLAGLFLAAQAGGARAETVTNRSLTLEDCIHVALEHNLDIQIERINPDLARYSLSGAYGSYDPSFTISGTHSSDHSPGGLDAEGRAFGGTESEADTFSSGIQGLLPWGLSYQLGGTMSDRYGTQPGTTSDPLSPFVVTNSFVDINSGNTISYLSTNYGTASIRVFEGTSGQVGFLSLRQPLLKNFWIDSPRLQIRLNRQDLKISEYQLLDRVIRTVTAVAEAYFNLIYAEDNVNVQEKGLELAERLVAENRRRVEVGAMAPLDERQAESQAATSRADLLAARAARSTAQRVLKDLLSDNYDEWKEVIVKPAEALLALPERLNIEESWRKGLAQRPDLQAARLGLNKQVEILRYQKNQLFPQLDLVGDYGYNAADREFSDAFGQVRRRENPFYSYGAQLTIPLANTGARASYKAAKATREQITLQVKQLEQRVLITIENALDTARSSMQRVEATRQARLYAEEALQAEETKLEKGKSTSFFVLDLQSKLTAARSAEIRALADYNIALARLAQNEGTTLERRGIELSVK
jgi:outer membrane protein TolC